MVPVLNAQKLNHELVIRNGVINFISVKLYTHIRMVSTYVIIMYKVGETKT